MNLGEGDTLLAIARNAEVGDEPDDAEADGTEPEATSPTASSPPARSPTQRDAPPAHPGP